ncbi:Citrate lyase, beta subunit [Moelleriella libera RCEF 2490]|uniref:Citrate lyase, beta subunit n=1 Tax=Moelleriella libera RCEF 2490 TaxID=1081109 RepID=A0A166UHI1_9HYPO|nr:Citrate lyase, beta subunit [Moelleriella libera RCEF 2490]
MAAAVLRRSLLYGTGPLPSHCARTHARVLPPLSVCLSDQRARIVPASSPRMLAKSLTLPPSDTIAYDLEDSVAADVKAAARAALHAHLSSSSSSSSPAFSSCEVAVRINAPSTPLALADLTLLAPLPRLSAIVVPKLLALVESARAVMDLAAICRATPLLDGLIFAAEDFALDLSITRSPGLHEFLYARSAVVTAARAARLPSAIDLVCTQYQGERGLAVLEDECRGGRAMGFNGKQCIHPSQVGPVQRLFAPGEEEVEWAVRLLIAQEDALREGKGAWSFEGKMIDAPVIGKARAVVAKAEQCQINVAAVREKWQRAQ